MSGSFYYPQCPKGDSHLGEVLNLVCLQPQCIKNSVLCGICLDEQHRGHKIKPLKVVINSSKKYLQHLKPTNFDAEKIKQSVIDTRNKLLSSFDELEKYLKDSIEIIRNNISAVFVKVIDQIQLKTGKNEQLLTALEGIKNKQMQYDIFVSLMQKLLAGVPKQIDQEDEDISAAQIEKSVKGVQAKIEKLLEIKSSKIKLQVKSFVQSLQKTADNPSIFDSKIDFKFSPQLKHTGVEVVNQNLIKSIEAYTYHFGLMEPSLQDKGNRSSKLAFKIKQNISNWLGVGICYKNTISTNNYTFNYSSLGHGAYLISSNGGSWSSIDSSKNNTVNSFNYAKDDIIIVEYLPDETKVVFRKKGTELTHTIQYEVKEDDELHLCGLFYYNNDEIEFLGYDED